MGRMDTLTTADLRLLHEALAYARKRSFQQAEAVRVAGLLDRIEELLLHPRQGAHSLRLSPPELEVLVKEIPLYCEALTQRGASPQGAAEATRLEQILALLAGRRPWWKRILP